MDKQIEELGKDIAVRMEMAKGIAGSMNNGVEGWLAEYLIEKGWAKINEGAVVLTREAYNKLEQKIADLSYDDDFYKRQEEIIIDLKYDKFELMNEISEKDNKIALLEETIECIKFNVDFTRKETAEKFAERVKMAFYYEFDELIPSIMSDKIDEIAEEISEGK